MIICINNRNNEKKKCEEEVAGGGRQVWVMNFEAFMEEKKDPSFKNKIKKIKINVSKV